MRKLNEMEYTTIKQLLAKGYEGGKVAEIVGRGRGLVSDVNTTKTYAEYVAKGKERKARWSAKTSAKPTKQLPLQAPTKAHTSLDLRQSIAIKLDALYDEIALYRRVPTDKTPEEQRDLSMALIKLEEAEMWLERHW